MRETGDENKLNKRMKRSIIAVTLVFTVVFLYMSYYIFDYSISNRQELISNSYNTRAKILASKNVRGTILDRNGQTLVSSHVNEVGKEIRHYEYGPLFAHVVGYSVNGRMGIEDMANYYLINSNAPVSVKAKADASGEKYPGDNIYTTLDYNLQQVASDAMGVYKGAIIVTEPSTGKVLAMVSKPDFDPATVKDMWDTYLQDKDSGVLVNRATQGNYPPGSTFKILTALEYIRENPDDFDHYSYNCTGKIVNGEDVIRCYHGSVHGTVDFMKSFAKSCNSSFANIGLSLDKDSFGKTLNQLLYNKALPTDIVCNQNKLTVNSDTDDSDMIQIVIGQGASNISPLQLNMITCAIANNGELMKPYLIDRVENCEGTLIKRFKPESYSHIVTEDESAILKEMMEDVVLEGTGTKLKGMPYYAGGKTGSAEYGTIKGDSHAWFTGYAGMISENEEEEEKPDICVTIIIEAAGSGGEYAVPIAKRIFDAYYGV